MRTKKIIKEEEDQRKTDEKYEALDRAFKNAYINWMKQTSNIPFGERLKRRREKERDHLPNHRHRMKRFQDCLRTPLVKRR